MQTIKVKVLEKKIMKCYKSTDKYVFKVEDDRGKTFYLENKNDIFFFKFNSSDIYDEVSAGNTYIFNIRGMRSRFFGVYPNIYNFRTVVK